MYLNFDTFNWIFQNPTGNQKIQLETGKFLQIQFQLIQRCGGQLDRWWADPRITHQLSFASAGRPRWCQPEEEMRFSLTAACFLLTLLPDGYCPDLPIAYWLVSRAISTHLDNFHLTATVSPLQHKVSNNLGEISELIFKLSTLIKLRIFFCTREITKSIRGEESVKERLRERKFFCNTLAVRVECRYFQFTSDP